MANNVNHVFGKVCQKHPELNGERYRSRTVCIGCARESHAAFYRANSEKYREKSKANRLNNIEHCLVRDRAYYAANKERVAIGRKEYYLKNKEKFLAAAKSWAEANKERKSATSAAWSKKNWRRFLGSIKTHTLIRYRLIAGQGIAKRYAKETAAVYKSCPPGQQVDHIVPLRGKTVNGLHVPWNLQYLPKLENQKKGNRVGG